MSERNSRQYLAWCNTHRLTLVALGLKGREAAPPTLSAYLADKGAGAA